MARDVDEPLRAAFAEAFDGAGPWIVVAVGTSKVGKSRALFEALEHCARGRPVDLVAPRDGDALRKMLIPGHAPEVSRAVLWLDDLEPFLGDNVTIHTLLSWRETFAGSVVAATLGGKGAMRVGASTAATVSALADQVLAHAREVEVLRTTPQELAGLLSGLSSTDVQGVERHGLAAFFVAAPKLERKLHTWRHEGGEPSPLGRALVDAVVDWALCGRTDAITAQALRELIASQSGDGVPVTDDMFAAALDWALRPVAGTIALIHHAPGGYEPFDYVVALARAARAPDDRAWVGAPLTKLSRGAM